MTFRTRILLPVKQPFRLDLTVDALRRLASNVVDVVGEDGTYYRALSDAKGTSLVAVAAYDADNVELRATGPNAKRWAPVVARMLGTQADLTQWYARAKRIAWLNRLSRMFRGVKPPRYASLWEGCAHSIVFQQISIHAAGAIMRRAIETLGEPATLGDVRCIAFPSPQRWVEAPESDLRTAGLSRNKVAHLRAAAEAFVSGTVDESALEAMSTPQAAQALATIRGIGPWSAAVMLLRGLGRLDTFPLRDSGVARALTQLAGEPVDLDFVLETLGPVRGMLYYHLLLGRIHRNQVAPP